MSNKNIQNLLGLRPNIFSPTVVRNIREGVALTELTQNSDGSAFTETAIGEANSFRYDPYGTGLKSTQQLQVDWSEFENHTFYSSAQVKTNVAFEKILNKFPIGGTKKQYELYFDELSGFEKYVYDNYPKYKGYFYLSRSADPQDGTFAIVKDSVGAVYPASTKKATGKSFINPGLSSATMETWLFLPEETNENAVVFQKLNGSNANSHGFTMFVSKSGTTTEANVGWTINSGSYVIDVSGSVQKKMWNHIYFVWDRNPTEIRTKMYLNHEFVAQSSQIDIGTMNFDGAEFKIGSGSTIPREMNGSNLFTPVETLSGALKETRFWHSIRTEAQRKEYSVKSVFSSDDLVLYFKYNEPADSSIPIIIDSSGKELHGTITGIDLGIRSIPTGSIFGPSPVTYEKLDLCPALLPDYPPIETFRNTLLLSASLYDETNPNLIVKLVPSHYFQEGKFQDSLETQEGTITTDLDNTNEYGSTKLGSTQVLLMLLYTWSSFFDDIKLYITSLQSTIHVDYDSTDTVPDQFLQFLAKKHGIELPPMFSGASIDQFINAENLDTGFGTGDYSLQYIQNQIWRRILINLKDVVTSKGTIHSVKSFIRATGIEPDNFFRIREYGGPTSKTLKVSRESRSEASTMLNFAAGGFIRSPNLIQDRVEPGTPTPASAFITNSQGVNIGTVSQSDGLLTSGSWSFEGLYLLSSSNAGTVQESLVRFVGSGSSGKTTFANLVADNEGNVNFYIRPSSVGTSEPLSMSFTNVNMYDGQIWSVSFGRERGDSIGLTSVSSSYFVRLAKQNFGSIVEEYVSTSYYNEHNNGTLLSNVLTNLTSSVNSGGLWFEIGNSGSLVSGSALTVLGLNNTLYAPDTARTVSFGSKVSQIRFWSKALSLVEWREHVRNFKSIGVQDPKINFNFESKASGSFEKIRVDVSTDQETLTTDSSGNIQLFDFSQNEMHLSGTLFPQTASVIVPQTYYYSLISPHFDENSTENKIRIRSFIDLDNVMNDENHYAGMAPKYEILASEEPTDNLKFSIDFSIVESLNQDIVNIFSSLDEFDNAIGNPALLFAPDYPTLDNLRNLYFNRLTDKINLKNFYELYKWFDTNIGSFISQLLPRKTNFPGTSFVIQSHMLERPKVEYQFYEQYLGDSVRNSQKDTITIQTFTGRIAKY